MEKVEEIKQIIRERTAEKKSVFLRQSLTRNEDWFSSEQEMYWVTSYFQKDGYACKVVLQPLSNDKRMFWLKWK